MGIDKNNIDENIENSSTNRNIIKLLLKKIKNEFNDDLQNEFIYPIYNQIYMTILPHYLIFLTILCIIVILLLIIFISIIINK